MKQRILITLNALQHNRGSEALIRGLIRICKEKNPDCDIVISSGAKGDIQTRLPQVDEMIPRRDSNNKKARIQAKVYRSILKNTEKAEACFYEDLKNEAKKADVIFVIGADNYDASYNMHHVMNRINTIILNATKGKVILYDCSLENAHLSQAVIEDMKRFDVITVREHETYETFVKVFGKEKVKYYPDPAFVMKLEPCKLPNGWKENGMVGINLSNLIVSEEYGAGATTLINAYHNLIEYILHNTELGIIFIPHVMGNADLSILRQLYETYKENARVLLIEDETLNAAQLKYIISNVSYLVTARTHASIAAYSTCIPTLVLGYSVKSIGIAKDLFGTSSGYVMPTSNIKTKNELVEGFIWLMKHGEEMKKRLSEIMPTYQKLDMKTGELLDD